jgi:hypothetical protein
MRLADRTGRVAALSNATLASIVVAGLLLAGRSRWHGG